LRISAERWSAMASTMSLNRLACKLRETKVSNSGNRSAFGGAGRSQEIGNTVTV
jgi:hypothetical protein